VVRFALPILLLTFQLAAKAEFEPVAFLEQYCVACHGEEKQKADFALHDIDPAIADGKDIERWEKVLEMVELGDMPPEDKKQPDAHQRETMTAWLAGELRAIGRGPAPGRELFPEHGNRLDHQALFSGEHTGPAYTRSRLWRISPQMYQRFASRMDMARKLSAPLQNAGETGFQDYAFLKADEATIQTMLQNCKRTAATLIHGAVFKRKDEPAKRKGSRYIAFKDYVAGEGPPNAEEMQAALDQAVKLLLDRPATAADRERYLSNFLEPNTALAGREAGLTGMLTALMMSPEFLFRMELGLGEQLPDGRRRLAPRETAYALSHVLFDYVDPSLLKAANQGRLGTAADVKREFERLLDAPDKSVRGPANKRFWTVGKGAGVTNPKLLDPAQPRLLRFFRQYFGYTAAPEVFKDDTRHDGKHKPWDLVMDADWFVLRALKDDRQVLAQLLTNDHYFVQVRSTIKPIRAAMPYNIDGPMARAENPPAIPDPIRMGAGQRAGLLTHPAWLVAHSGNFENDPVRRGKWIRERLLAGVVPELPIGVAAQLPEAPEQTLRERFAVVREESCWRCHKKMNPLGDVFEAYDDFGRFRTHHLVGEEDKQVIATAFEARSKLRKTRWREAHKKGHPEEAFGEVNVDTSGELSGTGDPALDGEVDNPIELMRRLAASDRVRQSFVRHVFRYWMGRNETLNDSPTLIAMDRAYVESDGSFRALLTALVVSDSFLCRK